MGFLRLTQASFCPRQKRIWLKPFETPVENIYFRHDPSPPVAVQVAVAATLADYRAPGQRHPQAPRMKLHENGT
jgi:hypothetical protein